MTDNHFINARRWVIKVGSSLVTKEGRALNLDLIRLWVVQIAELAQSGKQAVLVSSGAIAEGVNRLGWDSVPQDLHQLQAAAAVGQMGLMETYHRAFAGHGVRTAQILLTHEDFNSHRRYLNARATLSALLKLNVVPVINENDTVSTKEIQLGDNDTLAARVANLIDADVLLILTDQQGLFDRDPRTHAQARLVNRIKPDDPLLDRIAGPSAGALGRGGMITKVKAARCAAMSGTSTVIACGGDERVITRVAAGENLGTCMKTDAEPQALRKRWIMNLKPHGALTLDDGACRALKIDGRSLLPVGVTAVDGDFKKGDMVVCRSGAGETVAYGLSNYAAAEANRIIGKNSEAVRALVGGACEVELIHRDNMAVV